MANTIKIKRGLSSNIDNITLAYGELAITTDTNELYVGTESGNTKLNEKFSVAELPISSDGKVDLTQIITDATSGKLYKVIDPNSKTTGDLYFGTHAITFGASRTFAQGSNAFVQPGTILLSTGQYGFIYVFPMGTTAIYQLDINTKDNHYQAWVYDVTENYTYDKTYHIMPPSEVTTTTGKTAFTQDSEARTFTAIGAITGEDPVTYENVITLTADVKNILIYSVGSLIGDMGPADQIAQISITDISGTTSQILNTRGCSENLINTGPLTSGSKLTLTYTSGTYEPSNAQQVFTLEYYTETVTDASLQDFISSKVTHESTDRRQMDMILQKAIDAQYTDLQTQIFDLQGHVIENMLDAVTFRLSNLDNKSEFRFFGPSDSGVTHLGLSFEDVSLTSGDKFEMSATFQTASFGCTFEITESTSVKVKLTGDDVTNGVLSPVANKVYEIAFYWNGLFMSGVVRGVEHEVVYIRSEIAIGNGTKTTDGAPLYVFSDEECTDIIGTVRTSSIPEDFLIDGNLVYVGYEKKYSTGIAVAGTSASGCTTRPISNIRYYALEIKITNSPASITLKDPM